MMAYSSSPAASSFYSSVLSGPGPATDCSLSLKSTGVATNALATPHRNRLTSRFQHSKSHSISGSREATPVRIVGGGAGCNRRANSEKFDRQKTASLPLPKRRQLSLSATPNSAGRPDPEQPVAVAREEEDDDEEARAERARRARISVLNEDVFNMSTGAPDTCSFVTITGTAFSNQQRRDSNCTLNSNSYKEQYILGSNYNNNINRHSRDHYDSMHRLKDLDLDLTPDRHSHQSADHHHHAAITRCSIGASEAPKNSSSPAATNLDDLRRPTVEPKPHHYETNRKSLQDIL